MASDGVVADAAAVRAICTRRAPGFASHSCPAPSALAFVAAGNTLDANVAVGAGALARPLVIVRGWTAGVLPASVRLDGVALVQDADYFPSVRADAQELWITLNRTLAGAVNRIEVAP